MAFFRRRQPRPSGTASREPRPSGTAKRYSTSAASANRYRIDAVAEQQWGVASWAQLRRRGLAKAALTRAIAARRLHVVFPGVYSTILPALLSVEGRHAAALLCGGEGASLCGASGAWWAGLVRNQPTEIHVTVRGRRVPVAGIEWHRLDLGGDPVKIRRMPITPLARIPLDLAPDLSEWDLRSVLAELEFHHGVGPEEVRLHLGRGRAGAAKLRRALDAHTPQLAETRSALERAFALFIDECGFAWPEFNQPQGKATVDAIYRDERIAIELDGVKGHSGERRVLRDHRRDLHRRADGFLPLRYHFAQLNDLEDRRLIEEELDRLGVPRRLGTG